MKNKLFSYLFLSMLSSSGLQATVYAVGRLTKGNQKVYFLSGVPDQHPDEKSQAQCIRELVTILKAKVVYGDSISIKCEHTFAELKQIALQEVQKINATVLDRGTYNNKKQAFDALRIHDDARFESFANGDKSTVKEFFDAITLNQMIYAVETSSNQHVFVYGALIYGAAVWNHLISEGWLNANQGNDSIVTLAELFVQKCCETGSAIRAIQACNVQPVDISQWILNIELPQSQRSIEPTKPFFTARNIFACAAGVTAVAALFCVAAKNDFIGWLKKTIAPSFIAWGTNCKNPNATLKGLEYFGLTS